MRNRDLTRLSAGLLLSAVLIAGCGGDRSPQPFGKCGNGELNAGEACDPAFTCLRGSSASGYCAHSSDCGEGGACDVNDAGACLSTCVFAICGDYAIYRGVEECDGTNLDGLSCASFDRAEGQLQCDPQCRFDLSQCGPQFTPAATATTTATPTVAAPTPTATATPDLACGNGTIDEGETCDDGNRVDGDSCPSDCRIESCEPTSERLKVRVDYVAGDRPASSLSVLLGYPDGVVSIPGSGNDATVRERVTGTPMGAIAVRNDLNYELRVVVSLTPQIPPGQLFVVDFDLCGGATTPAITSFPCQVERASPNGPIPGVRCEASFE